MRLIKLRVANLKRFVGSHTLDVDEQLVALVGPNEAGKSTLLAAIDRLGSGSSPHAADRTRLSGDRCTVEGRFALDDSDRTALSHVHGGAEVVTAVVSRHLGDETSYWQLEPEPSRDLRSRHECRRLLEIITSDPDLADSDQNEASAWNPELFEDVLGLMASEEETLADAQIDLIVDLAARLAAVGAGHPDDDSDSALDDHERSARASAREAAADALRALARVERLAAPFDQVVEILERRLPSTALFRPEDRVLDSHYDLNAVADGNAPSALANLSAIAGLNLTHLRDLVAAGQRPHVQTLLDGANIRLREKFLASWRQARIYPYFALDQTLQVYVSTEGSDFSYPAERSDGLRWFLALYAFLLSRQASDLILLVDEAETHLHYDAQADLIDALMSQGIASKVIYTTHSIGCLPPDLGRGIRAIVPEDGAERSSIKNTYWWLTPGEDEKVGHIPLLFGMGASMLALTVPRFALVTEGPSDAILLPSIFRAATGAVSLPYRVVPGISELRNEYIPRLKSHAGEIVCLVDGDKGGRDLARNLIRHGVPADKVLSLSVLGADAATEDLVSAEIFAQAVNAEVATWRGPFHIDPADVPQQGRWTWLRRTYGQAEQSLNKNRVAGRMVDLVVNAPSPGSALQPSHLEKLRELDASIRALLGCT